MINIPFDEYYLNNHFYDKQLFVVIETILNSCIEIEYKINTSAFENLHGDINETVNSSGDIQKKLDIISNNILIDNLTKTNLCAILLSEENQDAIILDINNKYVVTFDPLDGSSNIDCNCCIGTIFSIYENLDNKHSLENKILRNGRDIICCGYVLYGPTTELVITIGSNNGVQKFTLDKRFDKYLEKYEFKYTSDIILSNKHKKIYSINESNCENWFEDMKDYIQQYKIKDTKYTQRYIGSMVADVHRTLLYGGMFCYPSDKKNIDGKLRLIYECFPMSKIIEEAGGQSIIAKNSCQKILDIKPLNIHQKTSILLGNNEEIQKYINILKNILI
jgi:fructose-1,6-bisphosphatase I